MKIKKSFTLLEMLVVIGIIAVLVSVGISSYSTVQKKARDAKRKSDLKTIQSAMEQYYSICGYEYPASLGTNIYCASPTIGIMPVVPNDPKTITPYPCSPCSTAAYTVCTTLESETPSNYCISNQQ
ncbi:MAG: Tfp pilus assembly protein PilE-like protein [Candidatus Roizmanbacteria bacterium GW2011_GWA2_35_19]|uniref:Tfp pilus assembly protein PilE-like protein n=2 Tax=Candidatus Roizmaniibacteriota TaxID=1752723 RepID=A0A0G0BS66_9BACT|nr:MAG: Tfp pilus assembly protein PilE-like protein [Candidatus Roizmanbacteria bacterium GW2011_GWC2_35_12]KKP72339.1 MAG: Tfp pilus assembly protein PilE-like protein [Candidatus Roizmanbacteria bacterium GW2011_GWA2_35_19]